MVNHKLDFSPEALLLIADEFCSLTHTHIRSFSALVALSSLFHASIHGVPLHRNEKEKLDTIIEATHALRPLQEYNAAFARALCAMYMHSTTQ